MNQDSPKMRKDCAILVDKVAKTFPIGTQRATVYRALHRQLSRTSHLPNTFFALKDINIEVLKGEKIGIIGNNGSGKTTLLKVIAGLYKPSRGRIRINGEVTLLAGVGIGMLDELGVEENIFLYGAVYGMERKKIEEKLPEIIEWAELQDFAGAKLKTLSSGMRTRLAFSAARYIDKDSYLLDEALTAGDKNFKDKCAQVFEEYNKTDKTFLITTHDLAFVKNFCVKTLWLHKGQQMEFGETEHVLQQYLNRNPDHLA